MDAMSSAGTQITDMENAKREIERILKLLPECPICSENYSDSGACKPHLLRCGHSLCQRCGDRICADANKPPPDRPKCPLCREEFGIPAKGFAAFPVNLAILEQSSMMKELQKLQALRSETCDKHPAKEIELFCQECRVVLCSLCVIEPRHKSHDIISLEAAAQQSIEQIQRQLDDLSRIDAHVRKAKSARRHFDSKIVEMELQVAKEGKDKVRMVDAMTALLMQQLQHVKQDKVISESVLDRYLQQSKDLAKLGQTVKEKKPGRDLFKVVDDAQVKVNELKRTAGLVNVEEILRFEVRLEAVPLTHWFPVDRINLVGELIFGGAAKPATMCASYAELERNLVDAELKVESLRKQLQELETVSRDVEMELKAQAAADKENSARLLAESAEREKRMKEIASSLKQRWIDCQTKIKDIEAEKEFGIAMNRQLESELEVEKGRVEELEKTQSELRQKLLLTTDREMKLVRQLETLEAKRRGLEKSVECEMEDKRNVEMQLRQMMELVGELEMRLHEAGERADQRISVYQDRLVDGLRSVREESRFEVEKWKSEAMKSIVADVTLETEPSYRQTETEQ